MLIKNIPLIGAAVFICCLFFLTGCFMDPMLLEDEGSYVDGNYMTGQSYEREKSAVYSQESTCSFDIINAKYGITYERYNDYPVSYRMKLCRNFAGAGN